MGRKVRVVSHCECFARLRDWQPAWLEIEPRTHNKSQPQPRKLPSKVEISKGGERGQLCSQLSLLSARGLLGASTSLCRG